MAFYILPLIYRVSKNILNGTDRQIHFWVDPMYGVVYDDIDFLRTPLQLRVALVSFSLLSGLSKPGGWRHRSSDENILF